MAIIPRRKIGISRGFPGGPLPGVISGEHPADSGIFTRGEPAAEEAFREGRRSSVWGAILRAELTFFQDYVLRLGFLDGRQGLVLSVTDAVNKFFKYAKLSELNRQAGAGEERKRVRG